MTGGIYHLYDGIYLVIYLGILHGIYLLDILLIPWYIPWYIAKVVYTTFGVVYQPDSRANPKCQPNSEREKKNQSGLIPRALRPLNCLK